MRARAKRLTVIGAAIGLVLTGAAIVPAAAAQPSSVQSATASTVGCSYFAARTVTAPSTSVSGVGLRGGEVITANVAPAREGDTISFVATSGLNFIFDDAPAPSGFTFRAPADGVYNLSWSLKAAGAAPSSIAWSFTSTCSTTVTPTPDPTPTTPSKPGKGGGKGGGKK